MSEVSEPAAIALPAPVNRIAVHPDGRRVYGLTGNQSSEREVLEIDTITRAVTATVPSIAPLTSGLAISPDGRLAYTCGFAAAGCVVTVIDTATASVVATIPTPASGLPGDVAVSATGDRLYVVAGHDDGGGLLVTLDAATGTVLSTVATGFDPACVTVSPDGRRVWVFPTGDTPVVVDTATGDRTFADSVPGGDVRMVFTPDGRRAYLTDRTNGFVWSIDPVTLAGRPIVDSNGSTPDVTVTPDGRLAVAVQRSPARLFLVDTATDQLARPPIRLDATPNALAAAADGTSVHVAGTPFVSGDPAPSLRTHSLEALLGDDGA